MPAARPTEAAIRRAIVAAREAGAAEVQIDGSVIRILVAPAVEPVASAHQSDEESCDKAFGRP